MGDDRAASDTEADLEPRTRAPLGAASALSECQESAAELRSRVSELSTFDDEVSSSGSSHYLPDGVVRLITSHLTDVASLLSLLAMCGTCRQFRSVASELGPESALNFGFASQFSSQPQVQRFRRLTPAAQEEVFEAAARLFSGYSEANFCGDGVTDRVLERVADKVGARLAKLRVASSGVLTGAGLAALLRVASGLTHVHLEELAKAVQGDFLSLLFERCGQLQSVHLSGMPRASWAACRASALCWENLAITKLHVRDMNLGSDFGDAVLAKLPKLLDLEIDGPARNIAAAAASCPLLQRVSYLVSSRTQLDEALAALTQMPKLNSLELVIKNFIVCPDQMRVVGMLPLVELRLDSFVYKQQPTLSRSSYSHVDNDGVKALVDSICNSWASHSSTEMQPLKLSVCGATALTHDAVSALLRLPVLTELDIGGCCRIIAMDKMRLVAKVRAGREMLESGRRPRNSRFPGLFL